MAAVSPIRSFEALICGPKAVRNIVDRIMLSASEPIIAMVETGQEQALENQLIDQPANQWPGRQDRRQWDRQSGLLQKQREERVDHRVLDYAI